MSLGDFPIGPVLGVSDLEASQEFYERTLGLSGEQTPGGYRLSAGSGTVAYLLEVGEIAGSAGWPVASFAVENLNTVVDELLARDVGFLGNDDLPFDLDERGISRQGGLAVAWMRDPDGNVITVFEIG